MGNKSSKGARFERELCKKLSLWWTAGKRDDVFWRSAGSGGMATNRAKRGGSAYGQHGDIQATDPVGKPLMDAFCIELKRGYTKTSFVDVIDKPAKCAQSQWEAFVEQAMRSAKSAGAAYWMLVQQRDRRDAVVFIPSEAYDALRALGTMRGPHMIPCCKFLARIRIGKSDTAFGVFCMSLDGFLAMISPAHIKTLKRAKK